MGCVNCGRRVVAGAMGLLKVAVQAVGIPWDRAADDLTAARRNVCRTCPSATRNPAFVDRTSRGLTTRSRCASCGCLIAGKTMLASERCPEGKW